MNDMSCARVTSVAAVLLGLWVLGCDGRAGTVGVQPRVQPRACGQSSECGAEQPVCASDGRCTGCTTDGDCSGDRALCDGVRGACVQCLGGTGCQDADQVCSPSGECEMRCDSTTQCDADQICHPTLAVCADCLAGTDCESDQPFCDPLVLRCTECRNDSDCGPEHPACVEGECVPCLNHDHCPTGERCTLSLECVEACTSDAQCEDEQPRCNLATGWCEL